MTELRLLLILFGIVLLAAIYALTRYGSSLPRRKKKEPPTDRQEPVIEPFAIGSPANEPLGSQPETAELIVHEHPQRESKVVAIRLVSRGKAGFPGDKLILALREVGLRHGEFGIFHRSVAGDEEHQVFSVASLAEPGSFDLTRIKIDRYPGVSVFMVLPGPIDGVTAFDDMLDTARRLAQNLEGDLLDEHGSTLSVQRERYLREEIIQYEHQSVVH
jgi:cell division protein ZipA